MDSVLVSARTKMQEAFDVLRHDFATVRTGKANTGLIENAVISAYNGSARLKVMELATIHIQDPQTIVVTPFDHSIIAELQKGIQDSGASLSPVVDGDIIRISIPPLTEERRRDLVKLVNQKAESGRIMIRQVRHEAMEEIKKKGKGNSVSEDEIIRLEKEIQKLTDEFIEKMDKLRDEKDEELMQI